MASSEYVSCGIDKMVEAKKSLEKKAEEEEEEEKDARLDLEEAELARLQSEIKRPTPTEPPHVPNSIPIVPGEYNSWGSRRPCSMETNQIISDWLRVHQADDWKRHDAAAEKVKDKDGSIHLVQRVILTHERFPNVTRFVYFCYAC